MCKKYVKKTIALIFLISLILIAFRCSAIEDVKVDVYPGILKVILQADPTDTSIVILGKEVIVSENDSMGIKIFQGKAISVDSNYAILFKDVYTWNQGQYVYNILKREQGTYKKHVIFESFVPPGNYRGISVGIEGTLLSIGVYRIPLELPENAESIMNFDYNFKIYEKKVTEVYLQISPLKSLSRKLDSYVFSRIAQITEVKYLNKDEFDEIVAGLPWLINPNKPFRR